MAPWRDRRRLRARRLPVRDPRARSTLAILAGRLAWGPLRRGDPRPHLHGHSPRHDVPERRPHARHARRLGRHGRKASAEVILPSPARLGGWRTPSRNTGTGFAFASRAASVRGGRRKYPEREHVPVLLFEGPPSRPVARGSRGVRILGNGDRQPDLVAVVEPDGTEITAGEMLGRCNQLVHGLRQFGLERGDAVATVLPNSADFYTVYLACMQAGLYLVPINNHLLGSEIAYILEETPSPRCSWLMSALPPCRQRRPRRRALTLIGAWLSGKSPVLGASPVC